MLAIARRTMIQFVESRTRHRDYTALKSAIDAWVAEAGKAQGVSNADIKARYATASIAPSDRIVLTSRARITDL